MNSTDPGHFFQTSSSLTSASRREALAKNKAGNPIVLPSKILALLPDPDHEGAVYVAESAGTARRVDLNTRKTTHIYRGPTAPLTSLALSTTPITPSVPPSTSSTTTTTIPSTTKQTHTTLYAACWDKTIWSWDLASKTPLPRLYGHSDFVKSLLVTRLPLSASSSLHQNNEDEEKGGEILISGGADGSIIIWALQHPQNGDSGRVEKLHTIRAHERGVLTLAVEPRSWKTSDGGGGLMLYSAGSDPGIKRWRVERGGVNAVPFPASKRDSRGERDGEQEGKGEGEEEEELLVHETSINHLLFSPSTLSSLDPQHDPDHDVGIEGENDDTRLYTASSDTTSKILVPPPSPSTSSTSPPPTYTPHTTLPHPDYVRSIAASPSSDLLATACRDGGIRLWEAETGELVGVYWGHYDEVTCLCVVDYGGKQGVKGKEGKEGRGEKVVSAGIDGTVRVWDLDRGVVGRAPSLEEVVAGGGEEGEGEGKGKVDEEEVKVGKRGGMLTKEEEQELDELMRDDCDE